MNFFTNLISKPTIDIILDEPERNRIKVKEKSGEILKLPTYYDRENVSGKIIINLNKIKTLEHKGIKIELVGVIEPVVDKKNISKFISLAKDIEPPGVLSNEVSTYSFTFNNVEKQYETYRGNNVMVRYLLRVTIPTSLKTITHDVEFGVINPEQESVLKIENNPIKLEVGIEDWLHLLFEVEKSKFHLKDCISGQVVFKKVSIRLKSMEVQLIKRETIGAGISAQSENEVIIKFEIMDGAPIKNENIPIRFFISPYQLSPTYPNVNNRCSVQYFINLVLIDVEERRYFKQHEIFMTRLAK